MVDISELMLVKHVTPEIYDSLKPYITALPDTTNVNVNTISETVFLSLGENLSAGSFNEERDKEEFSSIQNFVDRLQIPLDESGLSVTTNYFHAYGQVSQGDLLLNLDTLLRRDENGDTRVIKRTLGQL